MSSREFVACKYSALWILKFVSLIADNSVSSTQKHFASPLQRETGQCCEGIICCEIRGRQKYGTAQETAICRSQSIRNFTQETEKSWQMLNRPAFKKSCFYENIRRNCFVWIPDFDRTKLSSNVGISVWRVLCGLRQIALSWAIFNGQCADVVQVTSHGTYSYHCCEHLTRYMFRSRHSFIQTVFPSVHYCRTGHFADDCSKYPTRIKCLLTWSWSRRHKTATPPYKRPLSFPAVSDW